jgi:hypothetical protein
MRSGSGGNAPVDVADDRSRDDFDDAPDDALDTAALLDQGERLLAQSARLLRRLDAALHDRGADTSGEDEPNSAQ